MKFLKRLFCKIFGHQYCFGECLRCGTRYSDKEAEEVKLKPSCYGGFGSEACIIVGCVFQDSCEIEETESFKKAQEAEV